MTLTLRSENFRPSVQAARAELLKGRTRIRDLHNAGESGMKVCRALSDLQDVVISQLYDKAISDLSPTIESRIALVALGGSGRQDIAPWSDLDLMMLYQGTLTDDVTEFARRINEDLTDSGLHVGFSLRTPRDACAMATQDACVFSSLTESRLLLGNGELFNTFHSRFSRIAQKRPGNNIRAIIAAREKERVEYGETVYLLRPNVKRSRGALRDIHLIRWLGFIRFKTTDLRELLKRGGISTADSKQLRASQEFLLRIRNEMHFFADKPSDGLGRNEQVRLAEWLGYAGNDAIMGVEEFMREYFRYTSRIQYITDHFVMKSTAKSKTTAAAILSPLVNRQIDEHFTMAATEIGVVKESRSAVKNDLEQVLRLMQLACLYGKSIEHETWVAIRHSMLKYPDVEFTPESARRFMALLSNTTGLDGLLRRLHEMQVLQKILPEFSHARGLLQFNEYHKYTVDEHSLRAVEHLVSFELEKGTMGEAYRRLRDKNVLHLAMLLHDLGKGRSEDHSEVGRRIALATGKRLGLTEETTATIAWLVHKHLLMAHLSFHRDSNDPQTIAEFASEVATPERLTMLFLLTCADIAAVGPDVLTPWKKSLLTELYRRTLKLLTGNSQKSLDEEAYLPVFAEIETLTTDEPDRKWLKMAATNIPLNFLRRHGAKQVASQLAEIQATKVGEVFCSVMPVEGVNLYEVVLSMDDVAGTFFRLSGALSSLNLEIKSADVKLLAERRMFFWFQFEDGDWKKNGNIPAYRLKEIRAKTIEAVTKDVGPPRFRKKWGARETRALRLSRPEIRVTINNNEVSNATIIDVFAYNKAGLLYHIAKKVFELQLQVTYACISTYAHQVIDVLYVSDQDGKKIRDTQRLRKIESEIYDATVSYLEIPSEEE